jgi:ribosome biogenesis protein NSA1
VSDKGCNLFALDLRNGGILCGYKGNSSFTFHRNDPDIVVRASAGLSGTVLSIAPSPTLVASTALDRFARIHSTSLLPQQAGQQVEKKGVVLDKIYMTSIPTVIIWDGHDMNLRAEDKESDSEDENVWNDMEGISDSDGEDEVERIPKGKNYGGSRAG